MATTSISWGDGSGDYIYLSYSASEGNQTVTVTSDANTGVSSRTKDINFVVSAGGSTITRVLTVIQAAGSDLVVPVYSGVYPSYEDVARGFPRSGLPSEYKETVYTTFNSETLDTGEKTTNESVIEGEVYIPSTTATTIWKSDASSSVTTNTSAYVANPGNWRFDGTTYSVSRSEIIQKRIKLKQSKEGIFADGTSIGSYTGVSSFTSSSNLIFGSSASNSVRFYSFRHVKDGVTVSDYVPCRRISDSVAGMYDLIKREFLAGGTAGADVD